MNYVFYLTVKTLFVESDESVKGKSATKFVGFQALSPGMGKLQIHILYRTYHIIFIITILTTNFTYFRFCLLSYSNGFS